MLKARRLCLKVFHTCFGIDIFPGVERDTTLTIIFHTALAIVKTFFHSGCLLFKPKVSKSYMRSSNSGGWGYSVVQDRPRPLF